MGVITTMWMLHKRLRELIVKWFHRSQGGRIEPDLFDLFTSLWVAFNAWGTYKSQKSTDRKMIKWVKEESDLPTRFSNLLANDDGFKANVIALKNKCPIKRNRKYNGSYYARIADIDNFDEVLEAIYAIRCNFFHGNTSPDELEGLIEIAYHLLSGLFSETVSELSSSGW